VSFDEPTLVANARLLAVATLTKRLGLESLVNATVNLAGRVGGALPGRKILTLVHAIVAGASHIDHADVLRSGASASVLSHPVMAPSTLGTFLRAFTFAHIPQLDKVIDTVIQRAWALGIGPGTERLVVDMDSTICEVHGKLKRERARATRRSSAITHCSPPGPRPVSCSMPGCERVRPTPSAL